MQRALIPINDPGFVKQLCIHFGGNGFFFTGSTYYQQVLDEFLMDFDINFTKTIRNFEGDSNPYTEYKIDSNAMALLKFQYGC